MAVNVEVETVIRRPRELVSQYAADPTNAPAWYANIESITWQTPPPAQIGSRLEFVAHFLGRRLIYTYEIAEFVPGERLVMQTADGPFPMETTYSWHELDPVRTRMTLRNRGESAGFSRLAAPVMERAMRRATTKDLSRLKGILENS